MRCDARGGWRAEGDGRWLAVISGRAELCFACPDETTQGGRERLVGTVPTDRLDTPATCLPETWPRGQ